MQEEPGNGGEPALITRLSEMGAMHDVLADHEVRAALIQELRDLGVPLPGLVYRLILAATGGCESFLGASLASRLQALIRRSPPLASLLQRIANLQHGARAKESLRTELLAALRTGKRPDIAPIEVDEASSLDFVLALHSVDGFESVLTGLEAQTQELLDGFRRDLEKLFHDIVAPTLDWPDEAGATTPLGAFDRLKYTSGLDRLLGRETEIDLLHRFCGDLSLTGERFNFRWLLLTAQGGSGNTRLAYEFTRKELDQRWYAGKLDLRALGGLGDPAKWRPRRPTFMVVDYASAQPEAVRDLLLAFSRNAKHYDVPVRLLLLARTTDTNWTDRALPNDGNRSMVLEHAFGKEGIAGRPLLPMLPDAMADLMMQRFKKAGLAAPPAEALLLAAARIDPRKFRVEHNGKIVHALFPRPLFALAVVEEWIAVTRKVGAAGIAAPIFEQVIVLRGIIDRERQLRWRTAARDDAECRRYEIALALATYVQGLDLAALADKPRDFGPAARWLPEPPPDGNDVLLAAMGGRNGHLPPLEPDLLGEFFLLETLTQHGFGQAARNGLLTGGATINSPQPMIVLLRSRQDFPKKLQQLGLPQAIESCPSPVALQQFAKLSVEYMSLCARQDALDQGFEVLDAVATARTAFPDHPEIALAETNAVFNGIIDAATAQDWARVDALFKRLDALRTAFPNDPEIALEEAGAAFNGINHAGPAQEWTRVDGLFERFDALRTDFPDNRDIALQEAKAAFNGINHAGKAQGWALVTKVFARLRALARQWGVGFIIAEIEGQAITLAEVIAATETLLAQSGEQ